MRLQKTLRRGAQTLLLPVLLCAHAAYAEQYTLNLKEVEIETLIAMVSEATKKNFVVDERVKGKVTVISASPMNEDELYQTFLSVLSVHNFAAIPSGRVVKIVPEAVAKSESTPVESGRGQADGDEIATQIITVNHVSAAQLVPILRPLMPQHAHIAANTENNVLVVSDRAANIKRMRQIVERVDQASHSQVEVVVLQNASAAEVVSLLSNLEQKTNIKGQTGQSEPVILADERTNSVLVSAAPADRLRLKTLITHLDTPLQSVGNTQVVFLRHARAEDLLPVLEGVSNSLMKGDKTGVVISTTAKTPDGQPSVKVSTNIQADTATNSLVITAAPDVLEALLSVVRQLDVRRKQVLVEAVIAEVSMQKAQEFGVQWLVEGTNSSTVPIGVVNFGNSSSSVLSLANDVLSNTITANPSGALLGIGRYGNSGINFGMLVSALAANTGVNILSTPSLLTLDNQEAKIVVGQNVPFVTGQYTTNSSGSNNPFQTIQREDVGLTLRVKPQINEGDTVKMEVSQELSSIAPSTSGAADVVTNKRTIDTVVMVENNNIVVLGGLMDESLQDSAQKVPGLGDLPVVGGLFRYQEVQKEKRNLMVFLHPVILSDPGTQNTVSRQRYAQMRDMQLAHRQTGVAFTESVDIPVLPILDDFITVLPGNSEPMPPPEPVSMN